MSRRIFVAARISDAARDEVADYMEKLRRDFPQVRAAWEKPEKLHLTLKFLGKTSVEQLSEVEQIAAEISRNVSSFKLKIQDAGVFPAPDKARVLWLDVLDETKSLTKINRRLENECEKIGFAKALRKYVPHLTIARIKEPRNAMKLAQRHLQTKFEPVEFEVSEIVIYESVLQKTGSIYSVVSKHKLQ